jgi:uncharacterized tellurite resistance protein B-like protein
MASDKQAQLAQLKSVIHGKGGHHVFAAAKSALASRGNNAPLANNGDDDERAGRHALATFDAAFLMAAADGVLEEAEIAELSEILSMMTDGAASDDELGYLLDNFAEALRQEGLDERLANIAEALDTEDSRRLAFVTACGIAFLDPPVTEEEQALFAKLANALHIPEDEANGLLNEIKHALGVQ